ncbi:MAG: nucleotidyltransferase family protein [Pseudobdellovibrionaceae bacterium]
MKFGLQDRDFEILKQLLISPLKSKHAKLFVFGSRARNKHHPFSDLDLFYVEDDRNPISSIEISNIRENLENSNLPIKIDLVNWVDLAESYKPSADHDKIEI